MFLTRIKTAALLLLVLGLVGLGVGFAAQSGPAPQPRKDDAAPLGQAAPPPERPAADPADPLLAVALEDGAALPDDAPLPTGAVARLGSLCFVQDEAVGGLVLSPDGKLAAAYDGYGLIDLWDVATGKRRWQVPSEGGYGVGQLHFSPDGLFLVNSNSNGRALQTMILEVETGKKRSTLPAGQTSAVLAFTPDGKLLVGANVATDRADRRASAWVWKFAGRQLTREWYLGPDPHALAFTHEGKRVAVADDRGLHLWDVNDAQEVADWKGLAVAATALAVSANGKNLAVGDEERTVHLLETDSGKALRQFVVPRREESAIKLPDKAKGDRLLKVAVSADGAVLTAVCADGVAARWETATGKELQHFAPLPPFLWPTGGFLVPPVALSADGSVLAAALPKSRTLRFWDTATGRERAVAAHRGEVFAVAFAPDGRTLTSTGGDHTIRQWDVAAARLRNCWRPRQDHQDDICRLSADGRLAVSVSRWDRTLRVWDVASGQARTLARVDHHSELAAVFAPDGRVLSYLAAPAEPIQQPREYVVGVWDEATGEKREQATALQFQAFALMPDGRTLAVGATNEVDQDGLVYLWDARTGKKIRTIVGAAPKTPLPESLTREGLQVVQALSAAPDGRTLAGLVHKTVTDHPDLPPGAPTLPPMTEKSLTLRLWDVGTGKERVLITRMDGHLIRPQIDLHASALSATVRFSPDSRTVALGCENGEVILWETATGKERLRFSGHRGGVRSLAFAPDGALLASGGADGTILLWDLLGKAPAAALSDAELRTLWDDLKADDAARAFRALRTLARSPQQATAWFKERVRPVDGTRRVQQLLTDLESNDFAVREAATEELEKLGDAAEEALRRVLAAKPALEVQQRIEQILQKGAGRSMTPERLRVRRAIEVLERIGGEPARELLRRQAEGGADDCLTQEAQAALRRLEKGR